jgi:hypothetical protein
MTRTHTGKHTKIPSGSMGQVVEWPEVITEGSTLKECRKLLRDALQEMRVARRQLRCEAEGKGTDHANRD